MSCIDEIPLFFSEKKKKKKKKKIIGRETISDLLIISLIRTLSQYAPIHPMVRHVWESPSILKDSLRSAMAHAPIY
jgi:hypothetical protein